MFQARRISLLAAAALLALGLLVPGAASADTYATCVNCHALPIAQATGQLGPHGFPLPQPEWTCNNCHNPAPHAWPSYPPGYWQWQLYPTGSAPSVTTQMCTNAACHPDPQGHEPIHSFDRIPMPLEDPRDSSPINPPTSVLPLRSWNGDLMPDPFQGGGLVCSTCHNPHDPSYPLPGAPSSFLRIGSDFAGTQPLCFFCHTNGPPTLGHDLTIESTSTSVRLVPLQSGPHDLAFTVRNRGNDSSPSAYVHVEAEDQFGIMHPLGDAWVPQLYPDQSIAVGMAWSDDNWAGPVTFHFTLPPSSLRPIPAPTVIVRSFDRPAAPVNLRVTGTSWERVSLAWDYTFDPGVSFNVYRNGAKVNTYPIYGPGYNDIGLAPDTPHTYTVEAVSDSGGLPSAMSNRVGAQTQAYLVVQVPGQYPTIQAAINAASPGTSIHVAAGIYTESLFFGGKSQITVKGVDANGCVLEAALPGVVDLAPDGVNTFAGFTLRNTDFLFWGGDVAYGCVFVADPDRPQSVVSGGGFIANSVFDTDYNAISVDYGVNMTLANSILLGLDPIWPMFSPESTVLQLNNLFQYDGPWQGFPGEQNVVGDPGFCPGTYFTTSFLCRDRGTDLGMMVPGGPDIGVFEAGIPYTPLPPSGLAGMRQPGSYVMTDIHLFWVPSAGEACQPPGEYQIYRNTVPDFPPSALLTSVPGFFTSFLDIGVPPSQGYYYQVRAAGGWGPGGPLVSIPSNTVFVPERPNAPPVAVDDAASTPEEQSVLVFVQENDSDPDGDPTFIMSNTSPGHGSVWFDGLYVFRYTPLPDFNGVDSFSYTIQDSRGASASAVVTITVTPVNDEPFASDDTSTTAEDLPATIPVLANDMDIDGDALAIEAVTQGAHGSVAGDGSIVTYAPEANYHGADSFTYTVADGNGGFATATVSVTVTPVNDDPVATDDSATVEEDGSVDIVLGASDIDGDPLSYRIVDPPAHGTLSGTPPGLTYAPTAGYCGPDSFTFVARDGFMDSNQARVSLTVTPAPRHITASAGSGGAIAPAGTLTVPHGSVQVFTLTPDPGHHIAAVAGCGGALDGNLYTTGAVTADCAVTADFAINRYTLAVSRSGAGAGTVTSTPPGIDCGSVCSADYDHGSVVTLAATADAASYLVGWGGSCSGTGACTVTMDAAKAVTATFAVGTLTVTVPNGGESWRKGTTQTIRWTYAGTPGPSVKIELLKGGVLSKTVTAGTSSGSNGAGSYTWAIPKNQALGTDYRIRITSTTKATYADTSNANFAITK